MNLGIALADGFDLPGALEEFTTAVRLAPRASALQFNRGRVLGDLRRDLGAKDELETADKISAELGFNSVPLALTETRLTNYDRSVDLFRKVVVIDPQNEEARVLLGQDLAQLHQSWASVTQWKKVLEAEPENMPALYGLIRALSSPNSLELHDYKTRYANAQEKNPILNPTF